jgi:hypothetical protein
MRKLALPAICLLLMAASVSGIDDAVQTENNADGNFGKSLVISGQLREKYYENGEYKRRTDNESTGEVVARLGSNDIARAKLDKGLFRVSLGEVPADLLTPWTVFFPDSCIVTPRETKLAFLYLEGREVEENDVGKTYISYGITEYSVIDTKTISGSFDYIYSDRDAVIQGDYVVEDTEPVYLLDLLPVYPNTGLRKISRISLKEGWNKIQWIYGFIADSEIEVVKSSSEVGVFVH